MPVSKNLGLSLIFALALASCAPRSLPGTSYVPTDDKGVVINQHNGKWTLWFDGVNVTEQVGLKVTEDVPGEDVVLRITLAHPTSRVSSSFALEWNQGSYACMGCGQPLATWKKNKSE